MANEREREKKRQRKEEIIRSSHPKIHMSQLMWQRLGQLEESESRGW